MKTTIMAAPPANDVDRPAESGTPDMEAQAIRKINGLDDVSMSRKSLKELVLLFVQSTRILQSAIDVVDTADSERVEESLEVQEEIELQDRTGSVQGSLTGSTREKNEVRAETVANGRYYLRSWMVDYLIGKPF